MLDPVDPGPPIGEPPFTLGVASGDPGADRVVLWTAIDRPDERAVVVEIATDPAMASIVGRHTSTAHPDEAMTTRLVASGLRADTEYWYRFLVDGHHSPIGRTRTAPAPGTLPGAELTIGHLSCMRRSDGYWTALADLADAAPDIVVHCGDYVYEADGGPIRPEDRTPPTDLDGYRALWRSYKADPDLQAAHAVAPWLMTWDDHEVENNYQGDDPGDPPDGEAFAAQRAAAYRAWWEFTPTALPAPSPVTTTDLGVHRTIDWGALTRFVLLDSRQYRDDQPCPGDLATDVGPRCDASETVSMLGGAQESWVGEVVHHEATWTTIVNQTVLHQWRFLSGNLLWNLDQWDGYPAARRRLLDQLRGAPDPVVLTGDVHSSWAADLWLDFDAASAADTEPVGVEFVGPGVSSRFPHALQGAASFLPNSLDYIDWAETTKRGWVRHRVDAESWTAEFRLVDDITTPGSPVRVHRRVTVARGELRIGASEAGDES